MLSLRSKLVVATAVVAAVLVAVVGPVDAEVSTLDVTPTSASPGEDVTISGDACVDEVVNFFLSSGGPTLIGSSTGDRSPVSSPRRSPSPPTPRAR